MKLDALNDLINDSRHFRIENRKRPFAVNAYECIKKRLDSKRNAIVTCGNARELLTIMKALNY